MKRYAIALFLVIGVGQMWAGDTRKDIFLDASGCDNWYWNDGCKPYIQYSNTDAGSSYSDWYAPDEEYETHKYRYHIPSDARKFRIIRHNGDSYYSANAAFSWINSDDSNSSCCYKYNNFFIMTGEYTLIDANKQTYNMPSGGHVYLYANNFISVTNLRYMQGRFDYTSQQTPTLIDNTEKLYYVSPSAFTSFSYWSFVSTSTVWDGTAWAVDNITGNATDYTAIKYGYKFNNGNTYYVTKTSAAKGGSMNVEHKSDGYSAIPKYNTKVQVNVKESGAVGYSNGSTSDKPATTIRVRGTYLSGNGTSARSYETWSSGSETSNYASVISGKVTPSFRSKSDDWQFDGWYISDVQKSTADSFDIYQGTSAVTVQARFTRIKYTVNFDQEGGFGGTSSIKATYGSAMPSITLPTNPTGYTFNGYYSGRDGAGTKYYNADGSSARNSDINSTSGTTLYANWTINNHDITYTTPTNASYTIKAGDASAVSDDVEDVDYATTITLAATPANECYEFSSWTVTGATSGESITVINNQFSMPDEDVTVEATFAQVNLAKNKTAYSGWSRTGDSSGGNNTGEIASKAVDGDLNSQHIQWAIDDYYSTRGWWAVDLGDNYVLSDVYIYWQADNVGRAPRSYEIQAAINTPTDLSNDHTMDDATHWRTIKTISSIAQNLGSTPNVISFTLGEYKTARYLRIVNHDADRKPMAISEFEVYGFATEECYAANTPTASFAGIEDGQIKLNLSATNTNGDALTNFAVLYDGVYYDVTAYAGVGYVTMPSHRNITVRVYAYNKCMQKSSGYVDVEVGNYVNPLQNLAELKTTWVSYTNDQNDEKQANLNDGVLDNNGWIPYKNTGANAWMVVDLGDTYQISSVQTFFATERKSTSYKIYGRQEDPSSDDVRGDNTKWVELASKSSSINSGATESDVNESSVSFTGAIRYVRFESFAEEWSDANNGFKLLEFRVFGSSYKSRDLIGPVISTCEIDESAENETSTVLHIEATDAVDGDVYNFEISTDGGSSWTKYETNHSTNLVTIDGLENGFYTFTVRTYDIVGNYSSTSSVNVVIYDPSTNLALNKTVVAGYEPGNNSEHSEFAVDGSTSTGWTTYDYQDASVEWFYVDLGAYYQLSSIEMVWGEVYSTDYVFQVRQSAPADASEAADDNLWYPVAEVTDAVASNTTTTEVNMAARYLRFHSKARDGGFLRLYEIRVFGTGYADADTHVPVITTATATYNDDGKAYLNLIATDDEDVSTNWFYLYNPSTDSYSLVQANGSNQIVFDDLTACEEYTFQVQAMDQSAQLSAVSNIAVRVPVISTTNLALDKTATAGTTQGGFVASNAVDGNTGTMWSGNENRKDNENQWISIDLEDKFSIDSIKITWGGNSGTWAQNYELQVSYDGTDYEPIAHYTTTLANQNSKYTFTNVSAQYVRVWANKAGSSYGMEICEIAVYGNCYNDTDLPIMLFAEAIEGEVYATSADIRVGAIHKSIASTDLLYHVDYTDNTDGSYSGSTTISAASVTNGVFTLSGLQKGHSYTANIYVAKTSDIAENRSSNYKTVSFTTEGTYSKYYFASDTNGWLAVNGGEWTDAMDAWRFQTTEINGFYKLEHAVAADATWTYILYDRIHAGRTTPGDHKINVTAGKDFIMTMKGVEVYVSNYHTIYIAGDAVGTAENALTYALTWTDNTHAVWEGFVEPGKTFRLIFPDPYAGNESYVRTDAITPSAVTYSGSQNYARLTFNLNTWEYAWTPIDFVIYRTGDKADDSRATIGSVESYAGGTINAPIEFRMKVRDLDMWHSLCLPFTVSAVKVWDEDDGAYYDIVPYYRSGGTFYTGHYVIRTPDPEKVGNLPIEEFGNWYDPESPTGYLPSKDTPYIIQWHHDYFSCKYISFFGAAGQTIPTFSAGDAPSSDNVVKVCVNNSMTTGSLAGAYMLESDYGNGAWLRLENASDEREIPPFECYLLVNNPTRARYIAIRPGMTAADTPTGWDDVVNSEINTYIIVYSISGVCVTQYNDCSINEAGQRLSESYGEGLYILRADNESVKLMVGGK